MAARKTKKKTSEIPDATTLGNTETTFGMTILARDYDRIMALEPDRRKIITDWIDDVEGRSIFREAVANGMAMDREDSYIMGQFGCLEAGASFILCIDSHDNKRVMLMQLMGTGE